jgi:hypothetical protein
MHFLWAAIVVVVIALEALATGSSQQGTATTRTKPRIRKEWYA